MKKWVLFVKKNGKVTIVEYSEKIPEGCDYGNTALHIFSINLIEKSKNLGYHVAKKQEKTFEGVKDVIKYEKFIFDSMVFADKCAILEVERNDEFAPIKNGFGAAADSPETAYNF